MKVGYSQRSTILNSWVTRFITMRVRSWECLLRVVNVFAPDRFFCNIVGNAKMAMKNTLVIYEEVYRLMIAFIIYKVHVFQISRRF